MDQTQFVIGSILKKNVIPFHIFTTSYTMGQTKICIYILQYMYENKEYVGKCYNYLLYKLFEPSSNIPYIKKIMESFKSLNLQDFEKDEYGNNIYNIELIKWLMRYVNNSVNFIGLCMNTGNLDIVHMCYTYFNFQKIHCYTLWPYVIYCGHKHIIKWIYDLNPLQCKLYLKYDVDFVNNDIKDGVYDSLKFDNLEKKQEIISWLAEICDTVELEIYKKDGIICLPQRNIIKIVSEEELLWKKSLRCSWITACKSISNV
jgi:hypothetical protein